MTRLAARLVMAVVVLAAPSLLSAEVRIDRTRDGRLSLAVQPSPVGIWTPVRGVDAATVNPSGDMFGDGYPGYAASSTRLLAAWNRTDGDFLVVLRADGIAPAIALLPASGGVGTPIVTAVADAWIVAWNSTDVPEGRVLMTVASTSGETPPEVVSHGRLVAVVPVGSNVHILSFVESSAELWVTTYFPLPTPIPITAARIGLQIQVSSVRSGVHTSGAWAPCIEVRAEDALVAWAARDHQVGSIVLDELGVVDGARFVRGPSGSCTAVLNAASRERE